MSGIMNMFVAAKTTVATAVDAFFNSVSLLLNTSSTNGAQNNTFLDSSTNNFTITRNGNTSQGTFTPFSQTGWGNYFNGSTDYLSAADNAVFELGSGNFTIETWVNFSALPSTNGYQATIGSKWGNTTNQSYELYLYNNAGTYQLYITYSTDGATSSNVGVNWTPTVGVWYHVAAVRSGSNLYFWVNGTQQGSTGSISGTLFDGNGTFQVGSFNGTANTYLNGYLSNFRLTKGGALYTSTFTPSTTPLTTTVSAGTVSLLTAQDNRFKDNSTNAFALTVNGTPSVQAFSPFLPTAAYDASVVGGSGYFDGTGDYLTAPDNAAWNFSGDFTAEGWVYLTAYPSVAGTLLTQWVDGGGTDRNFGLILDSSGIFSFTMNRSNGTTYTVTNSTATPRNSWTHIAGVLNGTTMKLYVNGVSVGTPATVAASANNSTAPLGIGGYGNGNFPITGYISSPRIVSGSAVYTAAFTPPTAPLTAITNTSLLLSGTNSGIFDSAAKNVAETVGNAQVSTTQAKWGTTSMYFDGTGDNLSFPSNNLYNFGSSDFTIEFWFYPPSISYGAILYSTNNGSKTDVFAIYSYGSGQSPANSIVSLVTASGGGAWSLFNNQNLGSTTAATWQHVALVRNGSTFKGYINGVAGFTVTSSSAIASFNGFSIASNGASGDYLTGYIDDLRITRYARYTADFTPPTAAFPLQ